MGSRQAGRHRTGEHNQCSPSPASHKDNIYYHGRRNSHIWKALDVPRKYLRTPCQITKPSITSKLCPRNVHQQAMCIKRLIFALDFAVRNITLVSLGSDMKRWP